MINTFDKEAIKEFIISSDNNLMLALGVMSTEKVIRHHIINNFLRKLEARISSQLKSAQFINEWEILINTRNPDNRFNNFFQLINKNWGDDYSIMIEPQQGSANQLCYGIKSKHKTGFTEQGKKIHQIISAHIDMYGLDNTKITEWWPYSPFVAKEFRDWENLEVLSLLIDNQNTKALDYFSEKIMALVKIIEQNLGEIMQNNT